MILPHTHVAALLLLVLGSACLGLWANTVKLTGKWRFEIFYIDFAIGLGLAALVWGFTAGSMSYDSFSLIDDLMNGSKKCLLAAFVAGAAFSLANFLLTAAVAVEGIGMAMVIGSGSALAIGTAAAWFVQPEDPVYAFAGGALALICALTAAAASRRRAVVAHEELARAGKARSTRRPLGLKGALLALVSGLFLAVGYPLMMRAQDPDLGVGPYAATVVMAAGAFFSTLVYELFFMNLPVQGEPLEIAEMFQIRIGKRLLGLLGGAVWCTGLLAVLVGSSIRAEGRVQTIDPWPLAVGLAGLLGSLSGFALWRDLKPSNVRIRLLTAVAVVLMAGGAAFLVFALRPLAR